MQVVRALINAVTRYGHVEQAVEIVNRYEVYLSCPSMSLMITQLSFTDQFIYALGEVVATLRFRNSLLDIPQILSTGTNPSVIMKS